MLTIIHRQTLKFRLRAEGRVHYVKMNRNHLGIWILGCDELEQFDCR